MGVTGVLASGVAMFVGYYSYLTYQSVTYSAVPYTKMLGERGKNGMTFDCFETRIPTAALNRDINVTDMARSFFNSKVFRLEKAVLQATSASSSVLDKEINENAFSIGDTCLFWQVEERPSQNELLLQWHANDLSGTTWMSVHEEDGMTVLRLGSSIPSKGGEFLNDDSISGKAMAMFHKGYSACLLHSTAEKIKSTHGKVGYQ
eukprot:m.112035 g.112035  ORF g.112035 m.112035 type:complete len:204 (+) comp9244_c3_seq4:160-771(+)